MSDNKVSNVVKYKSLKVSIVDITDSGMMMPLKFEKYQEILELDVKRITKYIVDGNAIPYLPNEFSKIRDHLKKSLYLKDGKLYDVVYRAFRSTYEERLQFYEYEHIYIFLGDTCLFYLHHKNPPITTRESPGPIAVLICMILMVISIAVFFMVNRQKQDTN